MCDNNVTHSQLATVCFTYRRCAMCSAVCSECGRAAGRPRAAVGSGLLWPLSNVQFDVYKIFSERVLQGGTTRGQRSHRPTLSSSTRAHAPPGGASGYLRCCCHDVIWKVLVHSSSDLRHQQGILVERPVAHRRPLSLHSGNTTFTKVLV